MNDPQQKRIRALIAAFREALADPTPLVWTRLKPGAYLCPCQNCVSVRETDARKRSNNHDPE